MRIPIVDENDTEIGVKERSEIGPTDIYRVTALWLTNSKGEVLIAQRALAKKNNPGVWSCAVAGTVDEGETYDINMSKEALEEIGLHLSVENLRKGPKIKIQSNYQYFCQWYYATTDKDITEFTLQTKEIMDAKWISLEQLKKEVAESPQLFVPSIGQWFSTVLENA